MRVRTRPAGPPASTIRLLDSYLARSNVDAQQSPQHDPPGRSANTREPVYGGEVEAHGNFDDSAHARSAALWVSTHRALVGLGLAGTAGLVARRLLR